MERILHGSPDRRVNRGRMERGPCARQKRSRRVIFTAIERLRRPVGVCDSSRLWPSLYTRKSSLEGRYSQRRRTLELIELPLALYWIRLLRMMRGDGVKMNRELSSLALKLPYGRSTQVSERLGSRANCGTMAMRPL